MKKEKNINSNFFKKHLHKTLIATLIVTPIYAFGDITCPENLTIQCIKAGMSQYNETAKSICSVTSILTNPWNLSAASALPPGNYTLDYRFSYYGQVSGVNGESGYCMYAVENFPALAGLYNTQYINTGNNWQSSSFGGYICQNAQNCHFLPK